MVVKGCATPGVSCHKPFFKICGLALAREPIARKGTGRSGFWSTWGCNWVPAPLDKYMRRACGARRHATPRQQWHDRLPHHWHPSASHGLQKAATCISPRSHMLRAASPGTLFAQVVVGKGPLGTLFAHIVVATSLLGTPCANTMCGKSVFERPLNPQIQHFAEKC